jgi:hypothetical protein
VKPVFHPVAIVSRTEQPRGVLKAIAQRVMGAFAEERLCPTHASDPVAAILAPRKTYMGRCPQCGQLWT